MAALLAMAVTLLAAVLVTYKNSVNLLPAVLLPAAGGPAEVGDSNFYRRKEATTAAAAAVTFSCIFF